MLLDNKVKNVVRQYCELYKEKTQTEMQMQIPATDKEKKDLIEQLLPEITEWEEAKKNREQLRRQGSLYAKQLQEEENKKSGAKAQDSGFIPLAGISESDPPLIQPESPKKILPENPKQEVLTFMTQVQDFCGADIEYFAAEYFMQEAHNKIDQAMELYLNSTTISFNINIRGENFPAIMKSDAKGIDILLKAVERVVSVPKGKTISLSLSEKKGAMISEESLEKKTLKQLGVENGKTIYVSFI